MAEATQRQKAVNQQGKDGIYWLVNPAGAIHSVTKDHAQVRLAIPGWRLATEPEIKKVKAAKEQRFDDPICTPWSADPEAQLVDLE